MKVEVLEPKGYCSGVVNAIHIALRARKEHMNSKVYIFGMLVHNSYVTEMLSRNGIKTIETSSENILENASKVENGSVVVFTAHGHELFLDEIFTKKNCIIYDAVCPKVKINMNKIREKINSGYDVIYIGKNGHPEARAALSINDKVSLYDTKKLKKYYKTTNSKVYVTNQTTLNILTLKDIYKHISDAIPDVVIENEICSATRDRQEALYNLNNDVDLVIIVGDKKSSNTNRLFEVCKSLHPNILSIMVANALEIDKNVIKNKNHIVISSGSSTPNEIIDEVVAYIESNY